MDALSNQTKSNPETPGGRSLEKGDRPENLGEDALILNMLRKRESCAIPEVIKRYHEKLFSIANRICNNPADAEEVLQDVYMTVIRKIDQFEQRSTLSTWLYRVTVNASLMKLRSHRDNKYLIPIDNIASVPDGEEGPWAVQDGFKPPDHSLLSKELCDKIQDSVESLPGIYQSVFFLRDVNGFSIKETSKMLKTTPAAVKSRLHRSRFLLQERLRNYMLEN